MNLNSLRSAAIFLALQLFLSFSVFAQEPAANPTGMQFGNLKPWTFTMSFLPVSADGYLVIRGTQTVGFVPADGIVYERGQGLPGGKVVSVGNLTAFTIKDVQPSMVYHFAVYAYNGSGSSINYRQVNPLKDSVRTPNPDFGSYYGSLHPSSPSFSGDLTNLIKPHNQLNYSDFSTNIVPAVYERDTVGFKSVINCEYSGETVLYSPPFNFTSVGYSREHRLPKSWFTSGGTSNTTVPASDYHNLALTNLNDANGPRSNNPYGEVINPTQTFLQCKLGTDSRGKVVFEPMEDQKGDAARAQFYMMVCYNGLGGSWALNDLLTFASDQDVNVLYQWHRNDPPSPFEYARHEYIYSVQRNRNPFIDHPEWVDCIDFNTLLKTNACQTLGGIDDWNKVVQLYPNPVSEFLQVELPIEGVKNWNILSIQGQVIQSGRMETETAKVSIQELQSGLYVFELECNGQTVRKAFICK